MSMNRFRHLLRERALAGTATVTLTTGAALDIYPLAHVYNGRPGIGFRSTSTTIVIDIDLGAATLVNNFYLLGTNLERISAATDIKLEGGAAFPPVDYSANATLFGADDDQADFWGYVNRYSVAWAPALSKRYWRVTLTQTDRVADFTQVGEIFIDALTADAWQDRPDGIGDSRFSAADADSMISFPRKTAPRGAGLTLSENVRLTDAEAASVLELAIQRFSIVPLEISNPALIDNLFGNLQRVDLDYIFGEYWLGSIGLRHCQRDFDGDEGAY
jgi:hypothetical protein